MSHESKNLKIVGRAEKISFSELGFEKIPARIDTGARKSAVWASNVIQEAGVLSFVLFDEASDLYTGERHQLTDFEKVVVASSNGHTEERFKVKLLLKMRGKKIRTSFTLTNRSTQVYPVLVGRSALSGKFVVDVSTGRPLRRRERERHLALQALLNSDKVKK